MRFRILGHFGAAPVAAAALLCAAPAFAEDIGLPKGTSLELSAQSTLSSQTAKEGDTFRLTVPKSLWVDGRLAVPAGTVVEGVVDEVRTPAPDGDSKTKSGALSVHFARLILPGHEPIAIKGKLTSLKDDERRSINEVASKVSTGRHVDVVVIGKANASQRVSTLAGVSGQGRSTLAKSWSETALEPEPALVSAGSLVAMQLNADVKLNANFAPVDQTPGPGDRSIFVGKETVKAAQSALNAAGYAKTEPTGVLDDSTRSAITLYQLDRKQPATGDLDEVTVVSLGVVAPKNP